MELAYSLIGRFVVWSFIGYGVGRMLFFALSKVLDWTGAAALILEGTWREIARRQRLKDEAYWAAQRDSE